VSKSPGRYNKEYVLFSTWCNKKEELEAGTAPVPNTCRKHFFHTRLLSRAEMYRFPHLLGK